MEELYQEKQCSKCFEFKTQDNFYNDTRTQSWKESYCKDCKRKYSRINIKLYREKIKAKTKKLEINTRWDHPLYK